VVNATDRPPFPPEGPGTHLYRRLGGPQRRSGEALNISTPLGFDHQTIQPVASRYTDCAQTLSSVILVEFKLANRWATSLSSHPPDAQTENWVTDTRRLQQSVL